MEQLLRKIDLFLAEQEDSCYGYELQRLKELREEITHALEPCCESCKDGGTCESELLTRFLIEEQIAETEIDANTRAGLEAEVYLVDKPEYELHKNFVAALNRLLIVTFSDYNISMDSVSTKALFNKLEFAEIKRYRPGQDLFSLKYTLVK